MEPTILKPCSFCGKNAAFGYQKYCFTVGCTNPICRGHVSYGSLGKNKNTVLENKKAQWNKRYLYANITSMAIEKVLLLPCPFCGNKEIDLGQSPAVTKYNVTCTNVVCFGHSGRHPIYPTIEMAAREWNKRV